MIETFFEALSFPFFTRALLIGSVIALASSLLGTFVVVRREAVIGHALANIAFLGIAVGLLISLNLTFTTVIACIVGVAGILYLEKQNVFSPDSILELISQIAMALAILSISFLQGYRTDLLQYLFGDILAISRTDVFVSVFICIFVIVALLLLKREFLQIIFNEELARSIGVDILKYNIIFIALTALTVVVAIKIIGVILITAFLVIPANSAKVLAYSFNNMMILSGILGVISTVLGLFLSYFFNVPSGPLIIVTMGVVLFLSILFKKIAMKSR